MLCFAFLHFHLDSYIVNKGRRGELNENSEEVSQNLEVCIHMFRGSLHFFRGSFLAVFGVEFVLCSACDLSLPLVLVMSCTSLFFFLLPFFL
jgi:hypothetical protein